MRFCVFVKIFLLFSVTIFAEVDMQRLSIETKKRFERVPEFAYIMEEAEKMGIQVYLFGGTASAFAHYVRWDLEREDGDPKFQKERFDYDFTNIYRGNQDLDIVIDGSTDQARRFQSLLKQKYPHFVGEKDAWEVRLLKGRIGDKLPLLDDKDFKNQHTDTNSTGMLALNAKANEIVYRDLLDWKNPKSAFLHDVASARVRFLYSKKHHETSRFKDGKNPPVLSAIRYLAKLTQYEVSGTEEDLELVTQIIAEQDFTRLTSYGQYKAEEFGLKALLNSPDVEYAWNVLEQTGLRKKLIQMDSRSKHTKDSLSWWMSKEPLRSKLFGARGRTAKSIFGSNEIIVSHETNSFQAYDNITRSARGGANVFISREGVTGEAAAYGNGFYVQKGHEGARGTNLTIRFLLHPDAVVNEDFTVHGSYIVVKNKKAIKLIQENLNLSIIDFLNLLKSGEITSSDKGLKEKFQRKFKRVRKDSKEFQEAVAQIKESLLIGNENVPEEYAFSHLMKADLDEELKDFNSLMKFHNKQYSSYYSKIQSIIKDKKLKDVPIEFLMLVAEHGTLQVRKTLIHYFLAKEGGAEYPQLAEVLIDLNVKVIDEKIVDQLFTNEEWHQYSYLLEKVIRNGHANEKLTKKILLKEKWSDQPHLVEQIIRIGQDDYNVIEYILNVRAWKKHRHLVDLLIDKSIESIDELVLKKILKVRSAKEISPHWIVKLAKNDNLKVADLAPIVNKIDWKNHRDLVKELIDIPRMQTTVIKSILSEKGWTESHELVETLLQNKKNYYNVAKYILKTREWSAHPELLRKMSQDPTPEGDQGLAQYVFSKKHWDKYGDLAQDLIERRHADKEVAEFMLGKSHWKKYPHWLTYLIYKGGSDTDALLATAVFKNKSWLDRKDLLIRLIEKSTVTFTVIKEVLSEDHWAEHPEVLEIILKRSQRFDKMIVEHVLSREAWNRHPHLLEKIIERKTADVELIEHVFSKDFWFDQRHLLEKMMGSPDNVNKMIEHVFSNPRFILAPEVIYSLIEVGGYELLIIENLLSKPYWARHPGLLIAILKKQTESWSAAMNGFIGRWNRVNKAIQEQVLSKHFWSHHPYFMDFTDNKPVELRHLRFSLNEIEAHLKKFEAIEQKLAKERLALSCSKALN